jgi:BNR repeat-like domain
VTSTGGQPTGGAAAPPAAGARERIGPLEVVGRVVVAGAANGEPRCHRAWPGAEVAANGDLVVAYKEGSTHHRVDDEVVFVTRSADGGRTWERRAVAGLPGRGYWTAHGLTRLSSGDLLLRINFGRHGQSTAENPRGRWSRTVMTRSSDHGRQWQELGPVADLPELDPRMHLSYGRAQELGDGRLIAPFYGNPRGEPDPSARSVVVAYSADGGLTWRDSALVHEHRKDPSLCASETDLLRLPDGRLMAMSRANARLSLYRAYSEDEGRTWSPLQPTGLPGQSPAVMMLPSGAILCLYRDVTPEQLGVGVGISRDLGQSWEAVGHVYRGPNKDCAYPSPVLLADGTIFTPYYTSAEPQRVTGSCEIHGVLLREARAA